MTWLRTLMLLALIAWIGGIIFFSFVLAPTLFSVLPTTQMAGNVVSPSLVKLHWIGIVSAIVFLVSSLLYDQLSHGRMKLLAASNIFVLIMLIFTAISQFGITPRMRELRSGPLSIGTPSARAEFDRLHAWSTRLEGGVLLFGLGVVVLTARRFGKSN